MDRQADRNLNDLLRYDNVQNYRILHSGSATVFKNFAPLKASSKKWRNKACTYVYGILLYQTSSL
jgi:hypothetical protein